MISDIRWFTGWPQKCCVQTKYEIFKVKLISIKAYSPQDIISLIWAVHREIDLQKKDNSENKLFETDYSSS